MTETAATIPPAGRLWTAVDRLIADAVARETGVDGLLVHKLGPLAGAWFERSGRPVPARLHEERRSASLAMLVAPTLVRRIRDAAQRQIVLLKGPEVAALYPAGGRRFSDVDVLTPEADLVQHSLRDAGFVEVDHEEYARLEDHHHLHPLRLPEIWLGVEVHGTPSWPSRTGTAPPLGEILEAAVPSALGIEGALAPTRQHHALLLAAHAWNHQPLGLLRDLLDVAVLADGVPSAELRTTADRWGLGRLWRTTTAAIDAAFGDGPQTLPLRIWAGHLPAARERTVLENHLQRWLSPYWELPWRRALVENLHMVRRDLTPARGETARAKAARTVGALLHPMTPAGERDVSGRPGRPPA